MRFFDTDWDMILRWLEVWQKLSPATRRYYLEAKTHAQSASPEGYGAELEQALSAGLVEQLSNRRVRPTKASTPFRSVMAQLVKHPLFEGKPDREQLETYLNRHYTREEQQTFSGFERPSWDSRERPESFLHAQDVAAWEEPLLTYYEVAGERAYGYGWHPKKPAWEKKTWFSKPEITEAAKRLVGRALASQRACRLEELAREVPERLRPALAPALKACLRHALLFAALDPHSLEVLVGVCPSILYLANRPAPVPPAVEPCAKAEGVAYLLEDMTQVLALAATDECLVNQGSHYRQFFKSVETRLQEEFVPLPEWMSGQAEFLERLHAAADNLERLGFVRDTFRTEPKRKLKATPAGRRWLAQSPADRLKEVLFQYERSGNHESWGDAASFEPMFWSSPGSPDYDDSEDLDDDYEAEADRLEQPEEEGEVPEPNFAAGARGGSGKQFNWLSWQKSVWRQAPADGCVALDAFLDYHARVSLPKGGGERWPSRAAAAMGVSGTGPLAEEELCRMRLKHFFWWMLAPFGCVETARRPDRGLWFRLSPAGQYFVGLKPTVQYGPEAAAGTVVVQPNFEIVFLAPDLAAEVAIAPFAERCGRNVGRLFQLTRPKVLQAAARGATAERVLAALAKHCSTPVPGNVAAEIKAWFGACRNLAVRHSTLLQAGDAETALRVKQVLGPKCTALSATLLEWPESNLPPKLATRLREQGLFVEH